MSIDFLEIPTYKHQYRWAELMGSPSTICNTIKRCLWQWILKRCVWITSSEGEFAALAFFSWEQDRSGQVLGCCPPLGMAGMSVGRRALCPTSVAVLVDAHEGRVYVEFEEEVHTRDLYGEGVRTLYANTSVPAGLQTYSCLLLLSHSLN